MDHDDMPAYHGPAELHWRPNSTLTITCPVMLVVNEAEDGWTARVTPLSEEQIADLSGFPYFDTLVFPDGSEVQVRVGEPNAAGICGLYEEGRQPDETVPCPACHSPLEWTGSMYFAGPGPADTYRVFTCPECLNKVMRPHSEAPWLPATS
jgi:hypothetical protein